MTKCIIQPDLSERILDALKRIGLIPEHATTVDLHVSADGRVDVRFDDKAPESEEPEEAA